MARANYYFFCKMFSRRRYTGKTPTRANLYRQNVAIGRLFKSGEGDTIIGHQLSKQIFLQKTATQLEGSTFCHIAYKNIKLKHSCLLSIHSINRFGNMRKTTRELSSQYKMQATPWCVCALSFSSKIII